jgi:DNA modification methylase
MADRLHRVRVEFLPISSLKLYARNPRTHSPRQIRQIADSIRQFGFTNPILVDAEGGVIAGHGRVKAAKLLGMESVPTIRLERMSEAEKRAYVIADNKLAENAGWDRELLALELEYLSELNLDFDLTVTGFETAEIDLLIGESGATADALDELPAVDESAPLVSQLGDLWILGRHRLLCGDARRLESFEQLLGGRLAQVVFTDPPYNVPIAGHVSGRGAIRHREFAMGSGEMSEKQFIAFLKTVFHNLIAHSASGSIHFVCMDWRHLFEVLRAARGLYAQLKNLCVWNKDNAGLGSLYRSKHELVLVFKNGNEPHINNVELGRYGRSRTNVWDYPGVNTFRNGRLEELEMHPTVKPVGLVADAILDCSKRGGMVLDCFGGSGTSLIAAEKTGRSAFLLELEPVYVDVSVRRLSKLTGTKVMHAQTGRTFDELAHERNTSAVKKRKANKRETVDGQKL